jgi:energy-coupling factor transporter transmembrane protein EcfT
MKFLPRAWPGLLLFAAAVAALDYAADGRVSTLALRTIGCGLLAAVAFHAAPWRRWFRRLKPGQGAYRVGLFLVFVWHFTKIFEQEAQRLYAARKLAVHRETGPGGFRSLAHATASLFLRALTRAERFHAGLALREIEP